MQAPTQLQPLGKTKTDYPSEKLQAVNVERKIGPRSCSFELDFGKFNRVISDISAELDWAATFY